MSDRECLRVALLAGRASGPSVVEFLLPSTRPAPRNPHALTRFAHRFTRALLLGLALLSCRSHADPDARAQVLDFPVWVTARSEDQTDVPNVELSLRGKPLGKTDASGSAHLRLKGAEGDA